MNYFEHHIGDYRKDTGHLTLIEHGVYRQLLDTYYMDEKPLTLDHAKLMRSHCVRTADEKQALENVLADFFVRTDEGYMHKRCDVVIEEYRTKSAKAGESAKARWDRVRAEKAAQLVSDANALPTQCEGNANQEPVTSNQEPRTKGKAETQRASRLPAIWQPSDEDCAFCKTNRPDLHIGEMAERFRDYWHGIAGQKGCKLDWSATWRNWVRNEKQPARAPPGKPEKFDPTAYVNRPRTQPNERTIELDESGEPL